MLTFSLNRKKAEVPADLAVKLTLNEYLRFYTDPKLSGTKLSCGEGGCGACTVCITDAEGNVRSANSCLLPLMSVDKMAVTTVEGISGDDGKAHPVQQRMVQFHGSQCGFCTPGMVMQMYASIHSVNGGNDTSQEEIEKKEFLDGNLCRCTGYRPILDALKSFAKDTTVKDVLGHGEVGPVEDPVFFNKPTEYPNFLREESQLNTNLFETEQWLRPTTLEQVKRTFTAANGDIHIISGHTGHGVPEYGANLSGLCVGFFKDRRVLQVHRVEEFRVREESQNELRLGSAITISETIEALQAIASRRPELVGLVQPAADHLALIAGNQVRNLATIGGNIMMVRNRGFPADLTPVMLGLGATVDFMTASGEIITEFDLHTFVARHTNLPAVVIAIRIPLRTNSVFKTYRTASRPRNAYPHANAFFRLDLDVASKDVVDSKTGKLLVQRGGDRDVGLRSGNTASLVGSARIVDSCLIFGAIGGPPKRAQTAEDILRNKMLNDVSAPAIMDRLINSVRTEIPIEPSGDSEYRLRLIQVFMFKFIVELAGDRLPEEERSAALWLHEKGERISDANQEYPSPPEKNELAPVFEPHAKTTALAQAKGDSRYLDDFPLPSGTLFGCLVQIPLANATFSSLNDSRARETLGSDYFGIVAAKDVENNLMDWAKLITQGPSLKDDDDDEETKNGEEDEEEEEDEGDEGNPDDKTAKGGPLGEISHPAQEHVFLPPNIASKFAGQPVAMALAKSQRLAEQAAASIEFVGLTPPSTKESNDQGAGVWVEPEEGCPSALKEPLEFTRGNKSKTLALLARYAAKGLVVRAPVYKQSQSHFYMEPQSALAIPDEEGGLDLHNATQSVSLSQGVACMVTGLPQNRVVVHFRRVGGGFGGKISRAPYVGGLCAATAHSVRRPVRLVLHREVDMSIIGGRQEQISDFEVAVDPNGRIRALHYRIRMGMGASLDFSAVHGTLIAQNLDGVYQLDQVFVEVDIKATHVPTRTATRGPAHFEATLLIEHVMDSIADALSLNPDDVREVNLKRPGLLSYTGLKGGMLPLQPCHEWSVSTVWSKVKEAADYDKRRAAVEEFNAKNRWKKRGICLAPARYALVRSCGMTCKVDIFKDSSVQVTTGGSEIGQGLHTKVGQVICAAFHSQLGIQPELDSIRFADFSSLVFPQQVEAGGSTTSEMACFAAEEACQILVDRLRPFVRMAKVAKLAKKAKSKLSLGKGGEEEEKEEEQEEKGGEEKGSGSAAAGIPDDDDDGKQEKPGGSGGRGASKKENVGGQGSSRPQYKGGAQGEKHESAGGGGGEINQERDEDEDSIVTWKEVIEAAFSGMGMMFWAFNSTATGFYRPAVKDTMYDTFGISCSEVELDVLTGEKRLRRLDYVVDIGPSLNPAIDIGQVEGALVMGLGHMMFEGVKFDPTTGAMKNPNTWDYKIPTFYDIPDKFNIKLLDARSDRHSGLWRAIVNTTSAALSILGFPWKPSTGVPQYRSARAIAEPPLLTSTSIHSAIRMAIHSARGNTPEPHVVYAVPSHVYDVAKLTWMGSKDLLQLRTEGEQTKDENEVRSLQEFDRKLGRHPARGIQFEERELDFVREVELECDEMGARERMVLLPGSDKEVVGKRIMEQEGRNVAEFAKKG